MTGSVSTEASCDENPQMVSGDMTGVPFPTSVDSFRDAGIAFLTDAFRATGAMSADNGVEEIVGIKEFFGGGMGRKLWLDLRYARAEPGLDSELFVKFTREFGDPLRELFAPVMEPEVRFALLSRRPDFPVRVPACFFGDYNADTKCGLLITARIPYGRDNVEPLHDKCLDYLIDDPLQHYEALARSMAALASHHRAGRFGDEITRQFPFDQSALRAQSLIPYTPGQLAQKLEKLRAFASEAPQLMPAALRDPGFLEPFCRDVMIVLEREMDILAHLYGQDEMIALCHWNMNVDNAWFERDENGALQCGLLDWGGVSQMSLAMAFVGMICAAETDFLAANEDRLVDIVLDSYRANGGPAVDKADFILSLKLAYALLGSAWMLDAPALVEAEIPDLSQVKDRFDPMLRDKFLPRAQLQLMVVFLDNWRRLNIGETVRTF